VGLCVTKVQYPYAPKWGDFRKRRSTIPVEKDVPVCQAMADKYFRKKRKIAIAVTRTDLLELA
jgi:hypothetical protein